MRHPPHPHHAPQSRHASQSPHEPVFEALEARRQLAADFAVAVGELSNPYDRDQRTDLLRVPVVVTNVGDVNSRAPASVAFFLSTDDEFGAGDVLFATNRLDRLPGRGQSTRFTLDIKEPKPVNPPSGEDFAIAGSYRVIARLFIADSTADRNDGNNAAATEGTVAIDYLFGTVNNQRVDLTITLPDGASVTMKMERDGVGRVERTRDGRTDVTLTGTQRDSSVNISVNGNRSSATINTIHAVGPIKSIKAEKIVVNGNVIIDNFISKVTLGGLRNGALTVAQNFIGRDVQLDLGDVKNAVVTSEIPISNLGVKKWRDTDATPDLLRAPQIGYLSSIGDFQPSVTLASLGSNFQSIAQAKIAGSVSGLWSLRGGMELFEAGRLLPAFRGTFTGTIETLRVRGDMSGTLAAALLVNVEVYGSIRNANILSGAILGTDVALGGIGAAADNFRNSTIDSITVRGGVFDSFITVGIRTTDATLLDDDDTFAQGDSRVNRVDVTGQVRNSFIAAPNLPSTVRIDRRTISPANNPGFVRTLPR